MGNAESANKTEKHKPKKCIENEEPFDFAQLPSDLQFKIVDKFVYRDFAVLDQTSQLGNAVCWGKSYSLNHSINYILIHKKSLKFMPKFNYWSEMHPYISWHVAALPPTRFKAHVVYVEGMVNSGRIQAVSKLFEKNRTKVGTVDITDPITFKPVDLDRLIKAVNAKEFRTEQFVPRKFFELEAVQNLRKICLLKCGLTDDELLELQCDTIDIENDFVTAKGLNRFLKQWKKGKRETKQVFIEFDTSIGTRSVEDIIEGLEANVIWTPEFHEHSLVGKIKLEEFRPIISGDPEHMFSIFRSDDINDTRFVRISRKSFVMSQGRYESQYVMSYLSPPQYNIVHQQCFYCHEQFCEHRRRYSMPRLKSACPRFYNLVFICFKGFMYSFGALRVEKVILGERRLTRPTLLEQERVEQETLSSPVLSSLRVLFFDHV